MCVCLQFYTDRAPFDRELQLYSDLELRPMLPAIIDVVPNVSGRLRAPNGYIWPPCVIMEWGRPLSTPGWQSWPLAEMHQFLVGAAKAVAVVHSNGYVHRNVTPSNLIRRPKGTISLVDFGCAAQKGVSLLPHPYVSMSSGPCLSSCLSSGRVAMRLGHQQGSAGRCQSRGLSFGLLQSFAMSSLSTVAWCPCLRALTHSCAHGSANECLTPRQITHMWLLSCEPFQRAPSRRPAWP
jgi:serine/threonine protein kinase